MIIIGFTTVNYLDVVEVRIRSKNNLQFFFPKREDCNIICKIICFMDNFAINNFNFHCYFIFKNQTRPITNLAKAAQRFGKGDYINEFRPSGAREIRNAAYEFDRMAKRINRHLNQRSEMLSGISHDLRTPLTRLKLQLEMIKDAEISKKMSKDIDEMEDMLNDYLTIRKNSD